MMISAGRFSSRHGTTRSIRIVMSWLLLFPSSSTTVKCCTTTVCLSFSATGRAFRWKKSEVRPPKPQGWMMSRFRSSDSYYDHGRFRTKPPPPPQRSSPMVSMTQTPNDWFRQQLLPNVLRRAKHNLAIPTTTLIPNTDQTKDDNHHNLHPNPTLYTEDGISSSSSSSPQPPSPCYDDSTDRLELRDNVIIPMVHDLMNQIIIATNDDQNVMSQLPSSSKPPNTDTTPQNKRMSENNDNEDVTNQTHEYVTNDTKESTSSSSSSLSSSSSSSTNMPLRQSYADHPAITLTALAHDLWAHVIRPNSDIVIDATCGNGHDSVALARLLFQPNVDNAHHDHYRLSSSSSLGSQPPPHLICLDIQSQACSNTIKAISQVIYDPHILEHHIHVRQLSHERLDPMVKQVLSSFASSSSSSSLPVENINPAPQNNNYTDSVIGLVVYNLGYLPSRDYDKSNHHVSKSNRIATKVETTMSSLVDAACIVRVGGMISVMTYHSNPTEQVAVHWFMEGIALIGTSSSSRKQSTNDWLELWEELVVSSSSSQSQSKMLDDDYTKVHSFVRTSLECVMKQYGNDNDDRGWRVVEHRHLGRPQSPILITATRFK